MVFEEFDGGEVGAALLPLLWDWYPHPALEIFMPFAMVWVKLGKLILQITDL